MANMHSGSSHLLVKSGFNTAITATSNNGTITDTKGYTRALCIFYSSPSGAGTTSDCKLAHDSDSAMGSATDYANSFAQVTTAGGAKLQVMDVNLEGPNVERYIRLIHTGAGASAAGVATGVIILFRGRRISPTQENTVVTNS